MSVYSTGPCITLFQERVSIDLACCKRSLFADACEWSIRILQDWNIPRRLQRAASQQNTLCSLHTSCQRCQEHRRIPGKRLHRYSTFLWLLDPQSLCISAVPSSFHAQWKCSAATATSWSQTGTCQRSKCDSAATPPNSKHRH